MITKEIDVYLMKSDVNHCVGSEFNQITVMQNPKYNQQDLIRGKLVFDVEAPRITLTEKELRRWLLNTYGISDIDRCDFVTKLFNK